MENRTILPILTGLLTPILLTAAVWADDLPASPASIAENNEIIKEIPQTAGMGNAPASSGGSSSGESSVVSGLTLLTNGGNTSPVSATTTTAPIDISAPQDAQTVLPDGTMANLETNPGETAADGTAVEGTTGEVPEGEMLFPGKIKDIKLGASSVGTLSLTIRWFRPADFGLPAQQGGKVRIERAEQPEGPWTAVAPDAEGISTEQSGYWFAVSRDRDSTPFYIRTVRTDPFGKEWMDMIPTPINLAESFDKKPAPVNNGESGTLGSGGNNANGSGDFTNVSLEKQMPSYQSQMNGNNGDSTWNTPLNRSETEELTAALDQNHSSPAGMKPVDPNPPRKSAPKRPPTNPGEFTLNPLLTRGLGLFWNNKERVDADYPGVNNPDDYPAPYSGSNAGYIPEQQPQQPSEPPKRSIFMSPQEYRAMLAEEEAYNQQNPNSGTIGSNGYYPNNANGQYMNGQYNGQYMNGQYANGMNGYGNVNGSMNSPAWSPQQQGSQGTIYSSDAAMLNQTNGGMPAVIYEDANGNVIDNPFPNGQSPVIQGDFTLNGDMNGTMLSLPNESMNLSDGTFTNASYSDPMNGSMDMNSMNGPYTSQESTIGTTANYPGPVQQPLNTLPPKPDTK